jgi:hypothetical protein
VYAEDWPSFEPDGGVLPVLREAVRACCSKEAFSQSAREMAAARTRAADADYLHDLLFQLLSMPGVPPEMVHDILRRYEQSQDRSRFGVMNAVTSAARDTRDPELRWGLEELGGGIPALRPPVRRTGGTGARREAVEMAGSIA